ncbi:MAG: hypothetical protein IJM65_06755, partial [Bacteroidales bacterium]|nr:hypothetical protein [Bacteroidales bacterium]
MEQTCRNNSDNRNKMNNRIINKIATALIVIAATLGIAMAGGLVRWQGISNFFKGDDTARTAETKAKVEAAAKSSHNANYAHTTAFSGMPFALSVEGCSVTGEAGSMDATSEIEIAAIDSLPPLAAGMVNVTRGHAGYRLSPAGLRFARPVSVELGYDSLLLPKGHSAREIRTFLYNSESHHWEALPRDSVMEGSQNIVSQSKQAGEMINAIVQLPELPEAKAFTPTMLTELEAAHPASGITMMEPPAANSSGTANLSYPITVPAGRNGLQPNLSVSYSSEAGNGLLGMGWDMQLPAITVDSKWGVPRYDAADETECYSYNGQELLPSPHYLTQWESRNTSGNKQFRPRTEGSFDSIVRCGNGPTKYYWIVWDKGGTKYYYGTYDGSTVATSVLLMDGAGNIGHWPLCRVEDLDGNFMTYHYSIREQYDAGHNYLGQQLWPDSIVYTGHRNGNAEERGKYRVLFGSGYCPFATRGNGSVRKGSGEGVKGGGTIQCDYRIMVHKCDKYTHEHISDAGFTMNCEQVSYPESTDGDGKITWEGAVDAGTQFNVTESFAPPGYQLKNVNVNLYLDEDCHWVILDHVGTDSVKEDGNTLHIFVSNEPSGVGFGAVLPPGTLYPCEGRCDCEEEYPYDLRTDARLGFMRSSKEKLRRVVVCYKDSVVRSYSFCYGSDIFGRAQLRSIRQYGAVCGEEPYTHTFSYYEDADSVRLKPGNHLISNTERDTDKMHLSAGVGRAGMLVSPLDTGVITLQSALDATRQFSFGGGGGGYFGLGFDVINHKASITLDFDYSHNSGAGRATLADVTGDGLPDRVFVQSGQVYYKSQLNSGGFKAGKDSLRRFSAFLRDRGDQYGVTLGANVGGHGSLGGSYGTHRTTTYLSDVNGDGLPDVVSGGGARAAVRAYPPFNMEFDGCGLPRITEPEGYYPQIRMKDIPTFTDEEEETVLPAYDLVRVWRVNGDIPELTTANVIYSAELTEELVPGAAAVIDSVIISVEFYDTNTQTNTASRTLLRADTLRLGNSSVSRSLVCSLSYGDMLFFRARSPHGRPVSHLLRWRPQVLCGNTVCDPNGLLFPDAEPAGRCQLLQGDGLFICPFSGRIRYEDSLRLGGLSDAAVCEMWHNRTPKMSRGTSDTVSYAFDVLQGDTLKFFFRCNSNVDLAGHAWLPKIYYTHIYYDTVVTLQSVLKPVDTPESFMYWPLPRYDFWNGYFGTQTFVENTDHYTVKLNNASYASDSLTFVVKSGGNTLFSHQFTSSSDVMVYHLHQGDCMECYVPEGKDAEKYKYNVPFEISGSQGAIVAGVRYCEPYDTLYGRFYGGWSQFQYRHDDLAMMDMVKLGRLATAIADTTLRRQGINDLRRQDSLKVGNTTALRNIMETDNLLSSTYFHNDIFDCLPLTANGETRRHEGLYPNSWIKGDTLSLGCLPTAMPLTVEDGRDTSFSPDENPANTGGMRSGSGTSFNTKATDKVSHTLGVSASASIWKVGANSGVSRTKTVRDFIDLNGDGVPDFIDKDKVCYSLPCRSEGAVRWESGWNGMFADNCSSRSYSLSTGTGYTAEKEKLIEVSKKSNKGEHFTVADGSVSGNASTARDFTVLAMIDINGDGLPDKVDDNGNVWLNMGYGFVGPQQWPGLNHIGVHVSSTVSANAGIHELHRNASVWKASYSGGVSRTVSENTQEWTLADMNGDGLPDLVHRQALGRITYQLNTGSGFEQKSWVWTPGGVGTWMWSTSATISASLKATFGGAVFGCKVGGTPSVNGSETHTNSRLQISDFNGDGVPDLLKSTGSNHLEVCYAHLGRTGLLKAVTTPLGGSITMDYEMTEANVYHSRRWVMTKVVTHDSLPGDGCDSLRLIIRYDHGYYDRTEREFLGFAVVVVNDVDGNNDILRTTIRYYDNRSFYAKGSLLCEALVKIEENDNVRDTSRYVITTCSYDTSHIPFVVAGNTYRSVFPKLVRRQTCHYEGLPQAKITAWEEFAYENSYGNVILQRQGADRVWTGTPIQKTVVANISYHPQYNNNHCVNRVSSVEIPGYKKRTTEVDNKGHYTVFRDFYDNTNSLATRLQYDYYGNVTTVRSPNTTVHYTYDNFVYSYPTAITDTFGVTSELKNYDFRFGIPKTVVDQTGSPMFHTLDGWGRTVTVQGPKEYAAHVPYTIRHIYAGREPAPAGSTRQRAVSMAVTVHYDPQHPQNPIKTYTYCDGLGRIVQTRKEAAVNGAERLVISGHVEYDALGRAVANRYPTETHPGDTVFAFVPDYTVPAATVLCDIMDRPLQQTAPDGSVTMYRYGFDSSYRDTMLFSTTITDANNHSSTELKDAGGRPRVIHPSGQQPVHFVYDPVGNNIRVRSSLPDD